MTLALHGPLAHAADQIQDKSHRAGKAFEESPHHGRRQDARAGAAYAVPAAAPSRGIDIKLGTDPKTGKLVWDNSHDLTAAVDPLAVYRATKVISRRQEAAGRLYAMGRRATFGGVFPISTVLARLVASSLPQGHEQVADFARWESLTDEDREERREMLEDAYRRADRRLLRRCSQPVRAVVRLVCLDGDKIPARCERFLRHGLEFLADWWTMEKAEDE